MPDSSLGRSQGGKVGEKQLIEDLRRELVDGVDWDCEVVTLFRVKNLGCGLGPASAISETFARVEEAIVLEDDCVPHPFVSFPFAKNYWSGSAMTSG